MTTTLSRTLPITAMALAWLGAERRLSMMAKSASSRLAKARARSTPGVRGNNGQVVVKVPADVVDQHRRRKQVVHRDVEEPLDLAGMQVNGDDAVRPGHRDHVGHQFGADRHARSHFLVWREYP